jgi:outer membrane receptor for ferrienterochelin and colicins
MVALYRTSIGPMALVALLAWPAPARAGDDAGDIEKLDLKNLLDTPVDVWTAAKMAQKQYEAPAVITTVTREQIAVWGYRSVAEVLSHLLGFYVVDDHTSPNLAIRGISGGLQADSSIIKVLIDGHAISFRSTGGNGLGPELIPLSAVERLEIVRGPASALFGADAFLGVVNIRTRKGKTVDGATAWLSGGMAGEKLATDLDLSAGAERGDFDLLVAARRNIQDLSGLSLPATSPAPSIPEYNFGATRARGLDQRSTSVLAELTYHPAARPGTQLALFGYYSAMERGAEFGSLYQLANGYNGQNTFSENRVSVWQLRGGLLWEEEIRPGLALSVRGSYFLGGPRGDNRLEVGSDFYYVRRQFGFRGGEVDSQVEWTPGQRVRLVAGASVLVDDELLPSRIGVAKQATSENQPGDVIEAISVRQGRRTFANTGGYVQGTWNALGDLLALTGGLRYDRHNVYGGQLSERMGLVSSPRHDLHAKLLYGSAFKAPSPTLLYAVPSASGDVVGNPQLKPQHVRTGELQVSYQPADFLDLSTTLAYSVLSDKTEFVQQGINKVARNVSRAATVSWESMAELSYQGLLRGQLSYEVQRTTRRTGQDGYAAEIVGDAGGVYPRSMVHLGVVGQAPGLPLRAAVQGSYIGTRRASDTNILLNGGPYQLPPYFLLDARLSTVGFHLFGLRTVETSFAVSGKNLLGAQGPMPGSSGVDYPLSPRAFFLHMNFGL